MNILCDFDGVVVDTSGEVLRWYNNDYDDDRCNDDILEWSTHKFVKPECGKKIYDYYTADWIYNEVKTIDGAIESIRHLRSVGHRVIIVTSGINSSKVNCLLRLGLISDRHYDPDLVFAHDKTLVTGDVLIDDKVENCLGRTSILFDQPWNRHTNHIRRARGWEDVMKYLEAK